MDSLYINNRYIRHNVTKDMGGEDLVRIDELKQDNIQKLRECFYNGQIWTKNELSKQTHLSLAATTNMLQYLLKHNEIQYVGEACSTGGRKSKQYVLNQDFYHIAIMNIKHLYEGDKIFFQRVDMMHHILEQEEFNKQDITVHDVLGCLDLMIKKDYLITLVVMSIPGICESGKIEVCDCQYLENKDLGSLIEENYHIDHVIENDVNTASIALSCLYPCYEHMALIYQPKVEYVGCGLIIHHQLYNGFSHFAGELRYLPFYTHQQQDQMLKENPLLLLKNQILTLCCVMNPQMIGVCSDVIDHIDQHLFDDMIVDHHRPMIIEIKDLDHYIHQGLFHIAMNTLKKKGREK